MWWAWQSKLTNVLCCLPEASSNALYLLIMRWQEQSVCQLHNLWHIETDMLPTNSCTTIDH